jgi:peptidoglycan/xylan/chitin deacetylase (PgdA/CDA1 family)
MVRTALALGLVAILALFAVASSEAGDARCANGSVALTFDDGPSPTSKQLLAALQRHGLKATMFVTAQNAAARPDEVRAQVHAGMWIENHTVTHPHLRTLTTKELEREIGGAQDIIRRIAGTTPTLFRPPFLETDSRVRRAATRHDLTELMITVDSRDYAGATSQQIVKAAERLRPGGIMLLHDWPSATIAAIPGIAASLERRGLCAGPVASA